MLKRTSLLLSFACLTASAQSTVTVKANRNPTVAAELKTWYQQNMAAYERFDAAGIMALRAGNFYSVTPDGRTQDRAAMEQYIAGFLNGIRKWNKQEFTLDSLDVRGDTAIAIVSQHADRMALRADNNVHHVETWVVQRESWVRSGGHWLLWRVDQLRNQKRLVDGQAQ